MPKSRSASAPAHLLGALKAVNGRLLDGSVDRTDFLKTVLARWKELDVHEYPFIRNVVASRLPEHDERVEFLAGIDLILAEITASL